MAIKTPDQKENSQLNPGQKNWEGQFSPMLLRQLDEASDLDRPVSSDTKDDLLDRQRQPDESREDVRQRLRNRSGDTGQTLKSQEAAAAKKSASAKDSGGLRGNEQRSSRHFAGSPQAARGLNQNLRAKSNAFAKKMLIRWGIGVVVGIFGGLGLGGGFFSLNFLPNLSSIFENHPAHKERIAKTYQRAAIKQRNKYFSEPRQCSGPLAKACRIFNRGRGLSQRQINRLRADGLEPEVKKVTVDGKEYNVLVSLTHQGKKIDKASFVATYKKSALFRLAFEGSWPVRALVLRGAPALLRVAKLGVTRGKNALISKIGEFRQKIYPSSVKEDANVKKPDTSNADIDKEINELNSDLKQEATDELTTIQKDGQKVRATDVSSVDANPTDAVEVASQSVTSETVSTGILRTGQGVFGMFKTACSAQAVLSAISTGAKVVRAFALAKFAMMFMTNFDSVKAGEATSSQVEFVSTSLTAPSTDPSTIGQTIAQSNLFSVLLYNKVQNPTLLSLAVIGLPLLSFIDYLQQAVSNMGANRQNCRLLENWLLQVGFTVAGVASVILSGGWAAAVSAAVQAGVSVALVAVAHYMAPVLIQFIAGTPAPDLATDPRHSLIAGEALLSGFGVLGSLWSAGIGLQPLREDQAYKIETQTNEELAVIREMDHLNKSPFSADSPDSITSRLALSAMPYVAAPLSQTTLSNLASLIVSPLQAIGSSINQLFTSQAHALSDFTPYCPDNEVVKEMTLRTDAHCNVIYSMDSDIIYADENDEPKVLEYMVANNYIDEDGKPDPRPNNEYTKYINSCTTGNPGNLGEADIHPLTPEGNESDDIDTNLCTGRNGQDTPDNTKKLNMFRLYTMDKALGDAADAYDTGNLGDPCTISGSCPKE